jgi:multidrug efflux pump subunit AcrB
MNPVRLALRRPFTVLVLVVAVVATGVMALRQMPRDIFPDLGVPVLYVAQPYGGMGPAQMEGYITNYYEYHFLYITGIEHVESKSIQGIALIKLQFHPGTNMAAALAETVSYVNRARAFMPPGTVPPFVMRFDAGSVPVGNLVFRSGTRSLGELQDAALFKVRPLFATLPGVSAPPPFGGSQRTIVVRVDPERLRAYNLSPEQVTARLAAANSITPAGNAEIGDFYPMVTNNAVPSDIRDLETVPLLNNSTQTVYLRDIGKVEDASDIQTGYALVDGRRTVYIPVTKRADASTLDVVNLVKANLPRFQAVLPDDIQISYEFDQSPYVTRAISGLMLEILLGAGLTSLMVLLFLRDLRTAVIVVLNIPLALLASVAALWLAGRTINIMTLGGLALAAGMLVDEAIVAVENIHTHLARRQGGGGDDSLAQGSHLRRAALEATTETALPRLLAMLCVLAVFTSALFMVGPAKALFVPLSLAVGFAMIGSYLLSSTLVPILSVWLLRREAGQELPVQRPGRFDAFRERYARLVTPLVRDRWLVVPVYLAVSVAVALLVGNRLGVTIFPNIDAGQLALRMRGPTGMKIDATEKLALKVLDAVAQEAGPDNIDITLGFVGVQPGTYPINTIYLWTGGPEEAVLQVQLKRGAKIRIEELKERLRRRLGQVAPEAQFSFEPSDIVSRVMSFGSRTPVELSVGGPDLTANRAFAQKIKDQLTSLPALRDVQIGQPDDYPAVAVAIDRARAGLLGLSADQAARGLLDATNSSRYVTPIFWADPKSGVGYQVQLEVPQQRMDSMQEVQNIPVGRQWAAPVLLRNIAQVQPAKVVEEYDRYNMERLVTVHANMVGEDLGRVAAQVGQAIQSAGKPPEKVKVTVHGQAPPLAEMSAGLRGGLALAVCVILLLLVANFQSIRLAATVILTVPAVLAGVVVMLWVTGTSINLQSFMGAIMALGIAVANAILLVTFAEKARQTGVDAGTAAMEGARSRLRPILMTSLAMIAGMTPMAIGFGEAAQQTAPLGRAVIGGLLAATAATLLILPGVFTMLQQGRGRRSASLDPDDPAVAGGSETRQTGRE